MDKTALPWYDKQNEMFFVGLNGNAYGLPVVKINDAVRIAVFDMLSSAAMSRDVIAHMTRLINEQGFAFDAVISAETKGVVLAYGIAAHYGVPMVILRKNQKIYHPEVVVGKVTTYTTVGEHPLFLDAKQIPLLHGKRVLVLDDVISTGSSLCAIESILDQVGANIIGKAFVFAEGDAADRDDIVYIERLPLF